MGDPVDTVEEALSRLPKVPEEALSRLPKLPFARSKHVLLEIDWEPELDADFSEAVRRHAIALYQEKMEDCTKALQFDLEDLSETFGYGKKDVKEKDLILQLIDTCTDDEALHRVAEYVFIKIAMFRKVLQFLPLSWAWNLEVAECVYSATTKFKEDFFAEDAGIKEIRQAAEDLLKLEPKKEWMVIPLCKVLRKKVVCCFSGAMIATTMKRCLKDAPPFLKMALDRLKAGIESIGEE